MPLNEIAPNVFCLKVSIANVYFIGPPAGPWILVDTSTPGHAPAILEAAESLYGAGACPEAILLTHGHRDHAGSALDLANFWEVPVFAHPLELPYLTGRSKYPPLDPTVGGFLAMLGRFVPVPLQDLGGRIRALEAGREAPGLAGWEWHHTPGHAPGHVAFFRRQDGTLLAGDALTTMNLNSMFASVFEVQRLCGPPAPSTPDWQRARESVELLAELRPVTIACGHGVPMSGGEAVMQLAELAIDFPIPAHGRYVPEPAQMDESGVVSLPAAPLDRLPGVAVVVGVTAAAGAMFAVAAHRRRRASKADTPAPAS
ncbi:MAG TPA: MBL fold metallo-hydrolase [Bryobacteraceae bacterium]|nr:MBL fold metallo-hydrolase [Bryobacteraceae bacterium]